MNVCRALAEHGAPEGQVVVADEQTAGRGRTGNAWFSPAGQALYCSILLRPNLALTQTSWLTLTAAVAITDCILALESANIETSVRAHLKIKWLNDILLNHKKVCGILVETAITDDQLNYAIVGIGLNVNTTFEDAPPDVRVRATSLCAEWQHTFAIADVLNQLLACFVARYKTLMHTHEPPTKDYATQLDTVGKFVRVQLADEIVAGVATGITPNGALRVTTQTGERVLSYGHMLEAI